MSYRASALSGLSQPLSSLPYPTSNLARKTINLLINSYPLLSMSTQLCQKFHRTCSVFLFCITLFSRQAQKREKSRKSKNGISQIKLKSWRRQTRIRWLLKLSLKASWAQKTQKSATRTCSLYYLAYISQIHLIWPPTNKVSSTALSLLVTLVKTRNKLLHIVTHSNRNRLLSKKIAYVRFKKQF